MAQFDVYSIEGGRLVVDCQADALVHLATRVVAPLLPGHEVPAPTKRLHPIFPHGEKTFVLATHLLTAIPVRDLGPPIMSLEAERYTIIAALDLIVTGV